MINSTVFSRNEAFYPAKMSQLSWTQTHENSMLLKSSMYEMKEETPFFNLRRKTRKANTKLIVSKAHRLPNHSAKSLTSL